MMKKRQINKEIFKKTGEELHSYLMLMGKHQVVKNKKGKGSYKRNKFKNGD